MSKTNWVIVCAACLTALSVSVPAGRAAEVPVSRLIETLEATKPPADPPKWLRVSAQVWAERGPWIWIGERLDAQKDLAAAGAAAAPALLELLGRTKDDSVKISVLVVLGSMQSPGELRPRGKVAEALLRLLGDKNAGVRYHAIKVLGFMGHKAAYPELVKLATSDSAVIRLSVAQALGDVGDLRAAAGLLELVEDKERSVRLHAIDALGVLGVAHEVVPKLIEKLGSEDVNERSAAVEAVEKILGYDIKVRHSEWFRPFAKDRKPAIDGFSGWWKANYEGAVPPTDELSLRLKMGADAKQIERVRVKSLDMVAKVGRKKAVDDLFLIMQTATSKPVRAAAARSATALSGIRIEHREADSEIEWERKLSTFRRLWDAAK